MSVFVAAPVIVVVHVNVNPPVVVGLIEIRPHGSPVRNLGAEVAYLSKLTDLCPISPVSITPTGSFTFTCTATITGAATITTT